jgi:adenylate cyclase
VKVGSNLAQDWLKSGKVAVHLNQVAMTSQSLRFGSFTLDLDRLCLRGPSGRAYLRPKSFEVLRYLVEHAGRVVTKEEMLNAIWPDVTVGDESLTQCVSEVRRAIGDENQSIIKTVPRRGYLMDVPADDAPGVETPVAASAALEPSSSSLPLPDRPSIAVLPFTNMSGDADQEYFADGIVEDITTELSRFRDLFVIARNSSFWYKGRAVDVRQVGRELGVRYVLEGSIRRDGDRIRISAQLIEAMTGAHRWAERYDRDAKDLFAVQDEVARTVAAILAAHVSKAEVERTLLKPPASLQAYDYYLRAAHAYAGLHRPMQASTIYEARRLLDECLTIEPGYARGHALYSSTKVATWALKLDGDHLNPSALEEAHQWAKKAVQLDPNLPQARAQMAYVLCFRGMPDEAVEHLELAAELNRNFTDWRLSVVLLFAGQAERAVEVAKAHLRADPFAMPIARGFLGLAYLLLKKYSEALAPLREFVSRSPDHLFGRAWLAAAYSNLGQPERAQAQVAEMLRIDPGFISEGTGRRMTTFWLPEDVEHVIRGLRKAGLPVA